jgi:hypothetical protein
MFRNVWTSDNASGCLGHTESRQANAKRWKQQRQRKLLFEALEDRRLLNSMPGSDDRLFGLENGTVPAQNEPVTSGISGAFAPVRLDALTPSAGGETCQISPSLLAMQAAVQQFSTEVAGADGSPELSSLSTPLVRTDNAGRIQVYVHVYAVADETVARLEAAGLEY